MSKCVILKDDFLGIENLCGIDVAYSGDDAYCALALFDYRTMELKEVRVRRTKVRFPYVPTFLALREFEAMAPLARALSSDSDILLVDGHGILHPRKMGLASYIGLKLNRVTIGVAKTRLCGELKGAPRNVGDSAEVVCDGEVRGYALKTSSSNRFIYISPGHRISLGTSLRIVKESTSKRFPEPLRVAHLSAKKALL